MILTSLKEGTRTQHEQAEKAMHLSSRLQSVETYSQLLARFYSCYAPLEEILSGIAEIEAAGINVAERRKSQRLSADLQICGWGEAAIQAISASSSLPEIQDVPSALGCMYVMEGATLGGQIIKREVDSHLGFTPERGCSFFSGYGERTREMWKAFSAAVEKYSASNPGVDPVIINTAKETFACFERSIGPR